MSFSALDEIQRTGGVGEFALSISRDFVVGTLKEMDHVLLDQRIGFFSGNPAV